MYDKHLLEAANAKQNRGEVWLVDHRYVSLIVCFRGKYVWNVFLFFSLKRSVKNEYDENPCRRRRRATTGRLINAVDYTFNKKYNLTVETDIVTDPLIALENSDNSYSGAILDMKSDNDHEGGNKIFVGCTICRSACPVIFDHSRILIG